MPPKNRKASKKKAAKTRPEKNIPVSKDDINRIEFHRNALALMPNPGDKRPGIAIMVDPINHYVGQEFCSCSISSTKNCTHLKELYRIAAEIKKKTNGKTLSDEFNSSFWYRLASIMADGFQDSMEDIKLLSYKNNESKRLNVLNKNDEQILNYFSSGLDMSRLLERCTIPRDNMSIPTRSSVIHKLSMLTLTENERILREHGMKTRKQSLEDNFWYKFACHGYREFGIDGCRFYPLIEEKSGTFVLVCKNAKQQKLFSLDIPRKKVKRILTGLKDVLSNQHNMNIHPIPLDSIFDVKLRKNLDIEIKPMIKLIQENGELKFFERDDLKQYQYGDLFYIKELGILAEDQYPKPPPAKFDEPFKTVIKKSQVPSFLEEYETELKQERYIVDDDIKQLKILKDFKKIEITPDTINRDWCWLSITYGTGSGSVSLAEILRAKMAKQRFVATSEGWVDSNSPVFDVLDTLLLKAGKDLFSAQNNKIKLTRADIFRISAGTNKPVRITGKKNSTDALKNLLDLKPSTPLPKINGLKSQLRTYQQIGTEWLWFLYENGFGGLLCDDMGLGKTHQVMAFLLHLLENEKIPGPFLIISPTTVISHWIKKIAAHAPGLKPSLFHGNQRDLEKSLSQCNVLLTSYGILRKDINTLKLHKFSIVVFDEIQHIKNALTKTHAAAKALTTQMKIGLTGTPVENTLFELKALMDLTVPGYLGTNENFSDRYVSPIEDSSDAVKRKELSRLIWPFTLRRLKQTVLDELPDKIEDIMTCKLSDDQVKLYRDAIKSRAAGILNSLEDDSEPIPYIHIFALLNILKQICNHPVLIEKNYDDFKKYESGKWDLFVELLSASLTSGQKIVVYSQYLGMIEIISQLLDELDVGFVTLTGSSVNRGDIINRFDKDPDCRVFVGSLKASGTGIDLIAASVVIHYDRWWNAAREDQATDRVHRIGQKRGVQVFKLMTIGTLEEKIAAIIEKKKNLMDSIVREDDPGLLKTFSRSDLIQMLTPPV